MDYLVIKDNNITQICVGIDKLFEYLNIRVLDNGQISINGIIDGVSYNMQQWTRGEVLKDLKRNSLKRIEKTLQIGIFELTRVK